MHSKCNGVYLPALEKICVSFKNNTAGFWSYKSFSLKFHYLHSKVLQAMGKSIKGSVNKPVSDKVIAGKRVSSQQKKKVIEKYGGSVTPAHPLKTFPIVGIGASAGGLEAFSNLLEYLPSNLGMAYVFIQHLSPTHESFLPQIISRKTNMPVHQVKDKMEIIKDNVYIIPPNNSITITDGILELISEKGKHSFYPVDLFLSSLAKLYKSHAIGIILSGTATDGTLGLKDIKAEGGVTFAQDESAQYSGMPKNAVDMGYVDFIMSPENMAKELKLLSRSPIAGLIDNHEYVKKNAPDFEKIYSIVFNKKNIDFSQYKQTTIHRRIMRRMLLSKIQSLADYVELLYENEKEVQALYQDLLINVTNFFRDKSMNQALTNIVFPALIDDRKDNQAVRIWVPGCSTGEEVLTIAILLVEFLSARSRTVPVQLFGTDLSEKAIERARTGVYPKSAVQNISKERLQRFFIKLDGHYQVIKTVRDLCVLAPHNLLKDPPFSNMDLISCQNLLIYLESGAQQRIMQTFHYSLKNKGMLILGKSETIGAATDLFESPGRGYKVYSKKPAIRSLNLDFTPKEYTSVAQAADNAKIEVRKPIDVDKELEQLLLSQYIAPGLLVNKDLEIIRFLGAVSTYLEPTYGKASFLLMKMVKEEIAYELRAAIMKAKSTGRPVKRDGLQVTIDQQSILVHFEAVPFKARDKQMYFLIMFGKVNVLAGEEKEDQKNEKPSQKELRLRFLENKLKDARFTVKTISEEYETMREELQSANEEALSGNEELQSINEELETSKEELQSMNEELITINEELHRRNLELKDLSDYANAVFESKHEALIILNQNLRVRIANKGFYALFNANPLDTEGIYFSDLGDKQWNLPYLAAKLQAVQQEASAIVNFEVRHHFPTIGERTMVLNAQKLVMKDNDSLILVAIRDITEKDLAEKKIKASEERFRLLIQNAFDIVTLFDRDGTVQFISPSIESVLGFTIQEKKGTNMFFQPDTHPDDQELRKKMFYDCIASPGANIRAEFRLLHKNGDYRYMEVIARNMLNDDRVHGIVANYRDITDRKILEQQKDDFIGIASHELKTPVTSIKAYAQILQEDFLESGNAPAASMAEKMNSQIDRLTKLIADLLDFTHIEVDKIKFRSESYDINKLINEIVDETQLTTSKTLELKLDKSTELVGDRFRTGEILNNLLSNAIKYSPNSNKIIIASKVEKTAIIISVKDYGIGIDPSKTDKIFDRFYRVSDDSINTFPGLGLGLYLAAEIVKKQGGKVWVKSVLGQGSTFYFSLPVNVK